MQEQNPTTPTDPGLVSNPGHSFAPSPFLDPIPLRDAQIALPGVLSIGQSSDMLEQAVASLIGGVCSCEKALRRQEVGGRGVWNDTSWEPVIFMPSLQSLRRLPGRAWMFSGWSTGYLKCENCGSYVAVVSAALSGSVVHTMLHVTFQSTPPKPTKRAR